MSNSNGKNGVLMIKTAEKQEDIISNGMVALEMRVNLDRINNDCKYIVCCQDNPNDADDLFTDNAGYLIGVIGDTRKLPNGSAVIYLSQFATIYRENMWTKRQGAFVQYFGAPSDFGMYAGKVQFKPFNTHSNGDAIANATSEIAPKTETKPVVVQKTEKSKPVVTVPERSFPIVKNFRTIIADAFGIQPSDIESAVIVFKANDGKVTVEV